MSIKVCCYISSMVFPSWMEPICSPSILQALSSLWQLNLEVYGGRWATNAIARQCVFFLFFARQWHDWHFVSQLLHYCCFWAVMPLVNKSPSMSCLNLWSWWWVCTKNARRRHNKMRYETAHEVAGRTQQTEHNKTYFAVCPAIEYHDPAFAGCVSCIDEAEHQEALQVRCCVPISFKEITSQNHLAPHCQSLASNILLSRWFYFDLFDVERWVCNVF